MHGIDGTFVCSGGFQKKSPACFFSRGFLLSFMPIRMCCMLCKDLTFEDRVGSLRDECVRYIVGGRRGRDQRGRCRWGCVLCGGHLSGRCHNCPGGCRQCQWSRKRMGTFLDGS